MSDDELGTEPEWRGVTEKRGMLPKSVTWRYRKAHGVTEKHGVALPKSASGVIATLYIAIAKSTAAGGGRSVVHQPWPEAGCNRQRDAPYGYMMLMLLVDAACLPNAALGKACIGQASIDAAEARLTAIHAAGMP